MQQPLAHNPGHFDIRRDMTVDRLGLGAIRITGAGFRGDRKDLA